MIGDKPTKKAGNGREGVLGIDISGCGVFDFQLKTVTVLPG